ncbi:hydroxypyruvate isomerase family protein [Amorphus sp. 3PC139-8]|uniref:hydroxypyruvate isomerase family protein n=1 Tax=Amorphus sp. 3PC139-8 TaxID=2735676 RepID=UPI00345D7F66
MELIANVSLLFAERPLLERLPAAMAAGFDGVEIQFPYDEEVSLLSHVAVDCPVHLINAPAGAPLSGDVGLSTDAERIEGFRKGIDVARRFADGLGCRKVNVLAGPPPPGQPDDVTRRVLIDNVRALADVLSADGRRVMVEMVNPYDVPGYFVDSLDMALKLIGEIDHPSVDLQFDLYHMARTEPDLIAAIWRADSAIGHVQFADVPGRHEPGTGSIDFVSAFNVLRAIGYSGAVSAEYRPLTRTESGLDWMRTLKPVVEGTKKPGDASAAR